MAADVVSYGGWKKNLRLANREIELIVTAEVGPRIIRLGFLGGPNEFAEYPAQIGQTGGDQWRIYGGHRLWHAPEAIPRTYYPDNSPVEWQSEGEGLCVSTPAEPTTGIAKAMRIWLDQASNHVHLVHRLTNRGAWPVTLAAWALTVMAPGGRAIIPQEAYGSHAEYLLPARPLVLWRYTDMSDPRFTWGRRFIQLRQDRKYTEPLKLGALNTLGWAAYENGGRLFIKRFACEQRATYLDYGCNCETFTDSNMLEVESLSPIVALEPGASIEHEEHWYLHRDVRLGSTDESIGAALDPLL
ncbi:MAG: hypothetical protein H6Q06_1763 [Acidobacteria bacterium]|nr:hypothetical protein [Acidobacteriota bacterium]